MYVLYMKQLIAELIVISAWSFKSLVPIVSDAYSVFSTEQSYTINNEMKLRKLVNNTLIYEKSEVVWQKYMNLQAYSERSSLRYV